MHFLVISIKQSSAFTSSNMYVIPTLIPYKGNISQLKIRFHDNDHLESTKGMIYMYHQKKIIKGGGSRKCLTTIMWWVKTQRLTYFYKYFIPMPLPFLLITINRKEGTHTHIQIKTQCEFVMDHNKYMFTHQWSTHFMCYITGEILISVKSQDFTFGGIQWSMYIDSL